MSSEEEQPESDLLGLRVVDAEAPSVFFIASDGGLWAMTQDGEIRPLDSMRLKDRWSVLPERSEV